MGDVGAHDGTTGALEISVVAFDPDQRAREKASSRHEDARAIAAGEKSAEQVRRENASFAFKNVRLRFPANER